MNLQVEMNTKFVKSNDTIDLGRRGIIMFTPPIRKDYWLMRVRVSENQAIVCFPKFGTIGIGFQIEDADWNTNLPYDTSAEDIYKHIRCNKGDKNIRKETCIRAIEMLQNEIVKYLETQE